MWKYIFILCVWCICLHKCAHLCVHVWRPKINSGCLPLLPSVLFTETVSLTEPGAVHISENDCSAKPWNPPVSGPLYWGYMHEPLYLAFYVGLGI